MCVNFIHKWQDLQFKKSTPRDRFVFEKLVMAILFTLRVFARNVLRGNRRRNTFRILFWCLPWGSNSGFSSNKPTHYRLDHGDIYTYIYTCTYIYNWSFQPFSPDYWPSFSHHLCHKCEFYTGVLEPTVYIRFRMTDFLTILFTLTVFARNLLRGNRRRNIFSYFRFNAWPGTWTEGSHLINHSTTY